VQSSRGGSQRPVETASERRRRLKALPEPQSVDSDRELAAALGSAICVAVVGAVWWATEAAGCGFLFFAGLLVSLSWGAGVLYDSIRERRLLNEIQRTWTSRGIHCLVVHSNSPNWQDHIRSRWLPRLGTAAETLNWSERATWPSSLGVRVFERYVKARRNFNPAVIVFRDRERPLVFRFYHAFDEVRRGRPSYLERLETGMFAAVEAKRTSEA
jgi:hypothetical protein